MADEIKGAVAEAVAEAVAAVEAELRNADRARAEGMVGEALRETRAALIHLVSGLGIGGLPVSLLSGEVLATAIEGHVKDVKARLTEQVRLRVLAEARAADAEVKLADAEAALRTQEERLKRDMEAAWYQLRNAREDTNIARQECERLRARLVAKAEAEVVCPPAPAPSPAPGIWRLAPAFVERLPEHLRDLRVVTVFRGAERAKALCQDRNGLFWVVIFGECCGENPAWGEGERQVIEVRRCDAAGNIIPSGDYHAMRYPVALLPVVIPG